MSPPAGTASSQQQMGSRVARAGARRRVAASVGLAVALVLMAAAMLVPLVTGWNVHVKSFPPLHADWLPRLGPGTAPALLLGAAVVVFGGRLARSLPWPRLLVAAFLTAAAWMLSLAVVDGWSGIGTILDTDYEYLQTARSVTDVSATLHEYIGRIPLDSADHWPVHIAGHPPGALLFFVLLVRVGLGSGLAAGFVVLALSATTVVAVLLTLRRLGAERWARTAAPFLVAGPAAIWMAVSADGVFGAVAAWGICCLAFAATAARRRTGVPFAVAAGLLLGYGVMMSYGFALTGLVAIAVLVVARSWRPLVWAAGSALAVVLAFALGGFAWWEAYPVLVQRYWAGIATRRPGLYWVWADLSALAFSAGPIVGSAVALAFARMRGVRRRRGGESVVVLLTLAAVAMVVAADLSGMSRAEVERIWLPFVPWLLIGTALLPERWLRAGLIIQIGFAFLVQHLLFTGW
jgi:hypothetical protein